MNRQPSIVAFFGLVFLLTIPFWLLNWLHPVELLPGIPLSALSVVVPGLTAVVLTYAKSGKDCALQFLARAFDAHRVRNRGWYLVAVLVNPAIAAAAYMLMQTTGQSLPGPAPYSLAVIPVFLFMLAAAVGEELGWSTYATEGLYKWRGLVGAGLVLGAIWALWHLLPLLQLQRPVGWIVWWCVNTVALRVIMVWLYIQGGKSMFLVALFHAISNLSWQLFPENGSYYDPGVFGAITACVALAIVVARRSRRQPGRAVA